MLEEVYSVLKTLKTNTTGADDLPMYVFTKNIYVFGSILFHICNKIFCPGKFPTKLKTAKVIAIHKNGEKCKPISLIQNFFKILEKLVCI